MGRGLRIGGWLNRHPVFEQQGAARTPGRQPTYRYIQFKPENVLVDDLNARRQPQRFLKAERSQAFKFQAVDNEAGSGTGPAQNTARDDDGLVIFNRPMPFGEGNGGQATTRVTTRTGKGLRFVLSAMCNPVMPDQSSSSANWNGLKAD